MLTGSVAGGYIAQVSNLGVPYIIRAAVLGVTSLVALIFMKDLGFTPDKSRTVPKQVQKIFKESIDNGLKHPAVRWVMLGAPFAMGASFYAFYAMQPYILQLYGKTEAYGIAGLAAAVIAGSQIVGGLLVKRIRKLFSRRTNAMILSVVLSVVALAVIGGAKNFWVAVVLLVVWVMVIAAVNPIRQALPERYYTVTTARDRALF